jgi:asparagine synthase (glutamine-hydrolysing)
MGPRQDSTEKWILRKACEDLLPADVIWRKKAQFEEGSGTVAALNQALSRFLGLTPPVGRESEGRLYERLLCEQYDDPEFILGNAGTWAINRIAV